ncbi:MAG: MFS transporter [Chloroflexota bacterium]|nr:MFS transporter [Chloroflexota bacterium]
MSLLRNRSLIAATLGHFSVDMYSGMLPLILLVLTDPLGLSYSQVGLASMVYSLASSVSQPFFGWLGDKRGSRPMAVVGVAAIAMTVGVMRFVDQYLILLVLAVIAGLGSAAFHPQGAMLAAQTPNAQRGSAASIFMLGGNTGYAFGPIFGTAAFGLAGGFMPEMLAMLGLMQAGVVYWTLAEHQREFERAAGSAPLIHTTVRAATSVIVTLGLVIFLRSWVQSTISTYVPQVYKSQGFSTEFAGNVLFSILLPLAIGGLIGGTLSDRIGRRRVLILSTGLIGPALWGLLHSAGPAAFLLGPIVGVAVGMSMPVTLVMAQNLVPRGLGLMSGVVLGFTFIAGAVGVGVNGVVADQVGLLPTMSFNALLPLAAAALAFFLPDDRPAALSR